MSTDKTDRSGGRSGKDHAPASLDSVRERIDAIDRDLQRLLNERASCAMRVAEIKQRAQPSEESPVYYRPEREAQILSRLQEENEGPLGDQDVARLFREIISCCLNLEQPLTISYLGPAGTYTEAAAIKQFGHFVTTRAAESIDEVFREVESEGAHYGIVPVENSTEGMVNHTLDCFMESPLNICAEIELPIHHAFLVSQKHTDQAITEIISHSQSLAQCRSWLNAHYPGIPRTPVNSNAEAARQVMNNPNAAAVAGTMAAETYGLRILAAAIEDHPDNKTRFLVIGRQKVGPCGRDKTSLLVSTRNEPGALYKVLEPFHRHSISLTRIETRPAKSGSWSYVFFIDFDGHQSDSLIKTVLKEIADVSMEVRSLGSYPQAVV